MPVISADPLRSLRWRSEVTARLAMARVRGRVAVPGLKDVAVFCLFIGYPRSGHSLVGSLLDAHPNVVIAHELDALAFVASPLCTREALYRLLLEHDRRFTSDGRAWTGYDYRVEGQWQGRFSTLRVIGDKKGGRTTRRLARRPELLDRLRRTIGVPPRIVHVVRNPFDNIASMHRRGSGTISVCTEDYRSLCETNESIRRSEADRVHDLAHEDLIADPAGTLARLCAHLGVDAPEDYLAACAAAVFASPHRTRDDVSWTPREVRDVGDLIDRFPFLSRYTVQA